MNLQNIFYSSCPLRKILKRVAGARLAPAMQIKGPLAAPQARLRAFELAGTSIPLEAVILSRVTIQV